MKTLFCYKGSFVKYRIYYVTCTLKMAKFQPFKYSVKIDKDLEFLQLVDSFHQYYFYGCILSVICEQIVHQFQLLFTNNLFVTFVILILVIQIYVTFQISYIVQKSVLLLICIFLDNYFVKNCKT